MGGGHPWDDFDIDTTLGPGRKARRSEFPCDHTALSLDTTVNPRGCQCGRKELLAQEE